MSTLLMRRSQFSGPICTISRERVATKPPSPRLANRPELEPLAGRQYLRTGIGTVRSLHRGQTILGQGMTGENGDALVRLGAGHAEQELAHRPRRAAELVHDLDGER